MKFESGYYYGNEAEQYTFYRVPKALFTEESFKNLSSDAKILYGLMLDRMGLSIKNNWRDADNKIYIYYTLESIENHINCSHTKGVAVVKELETVGLIRRVKQGQGNPVKIYIKKFFTTGMNNYTEDNPGETPDNPDFQKTEVKTSGNEKSRLPQMRSADFQKTEANNTEFNNTDTNKSKSCQVNTDGDSDMDNNSHNKNPPEKFVPEFSGIQVITEFIKEQIEYDSLIARAVSLKISQSEIDAVVSIIADTYVTTEGAIRINGVNKPVEVVKSTLSKVDGGTVIYAIIKFREQKHEIKHKKNYLLTCLYNAHMEAALNGVNFLRQMGVDEREILLE